MDVMDATQNMETFYLIDMLHISLWPSLIVKGEVGLKNTGIYSRKNICLK